MVEELRSIMKSIVCKVRSTERLAMKQWYSAKFMLNPNGMKNEPDVIMIYGRVAPVNVSRIRKNDFLIHPASTKPSASAESCQSTNKLCI